MTISFKSTKQELPQDGEYILYIKTDRSLYYSDSPNPKFAHCEIQYGEGECGQDIINIVNEEGNIIWTDETNKNNPEIEHFWYITQEEFDTAWKNAKH